MKSAPLLVLPALALLLSGCGGGDEPASAPTSPATSLVPAVPVGTVEGRLLASGGPDSNTGSPLAGKLTIKGSDGSVLNAEIGSDGRFAIQLAPGDYRLTATSLVVDDGRSACVTEPAVTTLVVNQTVRTDVVCPLR